MGQCQKSYHRSQTEKAYFSSKRSQISKHFFRSQTFLENSSEWVVLFKTHFSKYSNQIWSRPILNILSSWENFHDSNTRVTFVWNSLKSSANVPKVDQSRACDWPQSLTSLQTFSYEVESDPAKKTLDALIQYNKNCTIQKIIKSFKYSLFDYFCEFVDGNVMVKQRFLEELSENFEYIDKVVLNFIEIIVKVIPKFFIDFPGHLRDIEEIVRNAVVSDELLEMLLVIRKESFHEEQKGYLQGLMEFDDQKFSCPITEKLEKDMNGSYEKAIKSLLQITTCKSIGQVHDSVAMLMNYINMGLYEEGNSNNMLEEDEIIQAFLLVIGKSSVVELPVYIDILNTFLDNSTLNIKSVGQGIVKLTYIVENSKSWSSFMSHIDTHN
jgi:hypothetical protein